MHLESNISIWSRRKKRSDTSTHTIFLISCIPPIFPLSFGNGNWQKRRKALNGAFYNFHVTSDQAKQGHTLHFYFYLRHYIAGYSYNCIQELYKPSKITMRIYIINLAVIKIYPRLLGSMIFASIKRKLL